MLNRDTFLVFKLVKGKNADGTFCNSFTFRAKDENKSPKAPPAKNAPSFYVYS